ncbi:PREDICTED: uncharacterized protein LOC109235192 [Nicotiana attenuata]|uniref:Uncharacterized protein n=1 Tax=Nicotiana attenuata TaxID=49451 RepID=A0A1J6I578_NICAT|nr:PREDICTED: uncharacterized protein LOC109235192 [Nicotiana attenuata]OIS95703.1 hypothetical protein A4A49_00024 [Nicotiana attenuata]
MEPPTQNTSSQQHMNSRKRPLDTSTPYYKMRLIVEDLRPHVIEVLRTPDFRNCKAATEIRQQLNLLMDLYKEMMTETVNPEAAKDAPGAQPMSVDIKDGEKSSEQQKDTKPPENGTSAKTEANSSQKQQAGDNVVQGSYVVGGSAFGWNFITYTSGHAIYYGRTKESFRAANVKSE